jgi:arylsulfatase A-like enzyme
VQRCTQEALHFIQAQQASPFFLYLPHTMPGSTPHPFSSAAFRGKSANGSYGDAVEELDWSTGEILNTLDRLGIAQHTLIIWTSDNGAPRRSPPQGSNAPYRGWGYDTSEGAMRMPCLMRWPGVIPAGQVNDALCTTLDLLPTLAALAGATLPEREIDGHDIRPILRGETADRSPWDEKGFCFYRMGQMQAVRAGDWKLYLPLTHALQDLRGRSGPVPLALYDVRHDPGEQHEVSAQHPAIVERLTRLAQQTAERIGNEDHPGPGQRPAGHVENPAPLLP